MFGFLKTWKDDAQRAKQIQAELCVGFEASMGVNFMSLHPTLHRCILKEALAFGSEKTMEEFILISSVLDSENVSDELKSKILVATYLDKEKKLKG